VFKDNAAVPVAMLRLPVVFEYSAYHAADTVTLDTLAHQGGAGVGPHGRARKDIALQVPGRRGEAEPYTCDIRLVRGQQRLRKLGRLSEHERQETGGHRVERTGVTGLDGAEQRLRARNGSLGCDPGRLVE